MTDEKVFKEIESLKAYQVVDHRLIEEMDSLGMVLEHKKSGARLFLMSNQDENKVFSIGFRTPPSDSTGLPHILEHSVLEGSEKFPVKDPFVELVKGSLNTFLNAMTYPDKTVYPVASCNDKDFQNLMDVYLDGVLHPAIYREKKIFLQEGWHYEMASEEEPLTINGVVYNEMKGAFSSPESVLDRYTRNVLFPDTAYQYESGGDPVRIPELTYEKFLEFHRSYYHPANSYIYLYGNMDMKEKLEWLDSEYLSAYSREDHRADSAIRIQEPFAGPKEEEITYSVTEEEGTKSRTYLSLNTVTGTVLDPKLYVAFQILEYTLIDAPGAVLKQALIDAGIGQDILGGYENGILQPYFSVIAKNAEKEQKGEFLAVIKGTLRKLADQGIDKKSLLAGLNYYEFRYREADYGSAPKGLMYGLWSMDSWLYDGDPMLHLEYGRTFEFLKKAAEEGYFEQLIREYLLDNPHEATVIVSPKIGQTEQEERRLADSLAAYRASLSEEEIQRLVRETKELKAYQDEPSDKEAMETIPMLTREDIDSKVSGCDYTLKDEQGIRVVYSPLFTSGIAYIKLLFSMSALKPEELPYGALLKNVLGAVDTEHYSYRDLASEIYLNTGDLDFGVTSYQKLGTDQFDGVFTASVKVLYEKLENGVSLLREILCGSCLDDQKRLGEILDETRSRARMRLENGSHGAAAARASSYYSPSGAFSDQTGGIGFFHFLEKTADRYAKEPEFRTELCERLKKAAKTLFAADNFIVSFTGTDEGYVAFPELLQSLKASFSQEKTVKHEFVFQPENRNEGFLTASQVNYVARSGSFKNKYKYTGALRVLKVIMNYEYLWQNLRVKGGAYGCMSSFGRNGECSLVSYRDPNLEATNEIYEGVVSYLRNISIDERDMTKYVIGAISATDTPLTPSQKGNRNLSAFLSGLTNEMLQEERDQILGASLEDIRALADILQAVLDTGALCVIGNAGQMREHAGMFKTMENLYH